MASGPGELVLVRHGETSWSRVGRHTGRTDVPLTELGREQAIATGRVLGGRSFALVLTSPLSRARETAALLGHPGAEPDPDLIEWDYGPVEGLTRAEVCEQLGRSWTAMADGVRVPILSPGTADVPDEWRQRTPGPGELVEEVAARAARVIARVGPVLHSGSDVLLVAHGHLLRILVTVWLGLAPEVSERFVLGTAAHSVLGFDRETAALLHWNVSPPSERFA